METKLTPAMRQWRRVKDLHPDKIVLFRMGDFYEMFGEDARTASEVLDIALTSREKGRPDPMPMAGIPHHALEGYLARLMKRGYKVALCDQVEDAALAKGLVKREVTRVVTPGTVLEEGLVEARERVLLAAWNPSPNCVGLAWADLSSGDVAVWRSSAPEAEDRLKALDPAEVLLPEGSSVEPPAGARVLTALPAKAFNPGGALVDVLARFNLPRGLPGLPPDPEPLGALRALLEYALERGGVHFQVPRYETPGSFLAMDEATRRNLELVSNQEDGGRSGTLLDCLDATLTPMGGRLLREWVTEPPCRLEEIRARQDTVEGWHARPDLLNRARQILKGFPDLARLVARFGAGIASPRDAGGLRTALGRLPELREVFERAGEPLPALQAAMPEVERWAEHLNRSLAESLPPHARDGGMFARGWNGRLDELCALSENARGSLLELEAAERAATGIPSLKVKYNKIFGYFIEVSKTNLARIPERYERRQTLVGGERFVVPELKELESRILTAKQDRLSLEGELWEALTRELAPALPAFRDLAAELARADALAGFATQARERGYVRPSLVDEPVLDIEDARHPVLERDPRHQPFVPNPIQVDTGRRQVLLLTGPNMGGKSTYLRQTALLALMAHLGSWVPARAARIGLVDRLFCRVGAGDSLLRGLSTFMVEMTETAAILRGATRRSLVILDEVGRGTSTYDGLAIAWAVVEALVPPGGPGCRTLFATHYHELTELGRTLSGVHNLTMGVRELGGKVVFLRTVEEGAADRSYGIHVAELAGVPEPVVSRAREVLGNLEARREGVGLDGEMGRTVRQGSLFAGESPSASHPVLEELRRMSLEKLTPMEALFILDRLKKKLP